MIAVNLAFPKTTSRLERKRRKGTDAMKRWTLANPERARLTRKRNRSTEKARSTSKKYRDRNREKLNARARAYRAADLVRAKAKEQRARELLKKRPDYRQRLRRQNFKSNYGITLEQYDALEKTQGGACAICSTKPEGRGVHRVLHVDHSHGSNKVRGLLCGRCNVMLGYGRDDVKILTAAIEYLERSR